MDTNHLLSLAPDVDEINIKINSCKAKPTKDCRNDILQQGLAYYEHLFLDRKPSRVKSRGDKTVEVVGNVANVILPVITLKESEENRKPAFFPLLTIVRALFGIDDERAKLARAESNLLRSKIQIGDEVSAQHR